MFKQISRSLFMLWLVVAALVVIGCGSLVQAHSSQNTASVPHHAPSLTPQPTLATVNWANFTYMSSCYGNTQPFHVKNGQATNNYVHFYVFAPKFGALTGNGRVDAVVPYQCTAADAMGVHVFVYTGSPKHPNLIGDLPIADPKGEIANVTRITIAREALNLEGTGYTSKAPRCCPDLFIKSSYHWNGKTFVLTAFQSHPYVASHS